MEDTQCARFRSPGFGTKISEINWMGYCVLLKSINNESFETPEKFNTIKTLLNFFDKFKQNFMYNHSASPRGGHWRGVVVRCIDLTCAFMI